MASSTSAAPQIKGFAIRGLLKFVKESDYPSGIAGILRQVAADDQHHFSDQILSSVWYPYEAYSRLLGTVVRELGGDQQELLERMGTYAVRQDTGTIFRIVASIASLERLIKMAPMLWQRYSTRGRFELVQLEENSMVCRMLEFPEIDSLHCRLVAGWIRGLGEANGADSIAVEKSACVHHESEFCEYRAQWIAS